MEIHGPRRRTDPDGGTHHRPPVSPVRTRTFPLKLSVQPTHPKGGRVGHEAPGARRLSLEVVHFPGEEVVVDRLHPSPYFSNGSGVGK